MNYWLLKVEPDKYPYESLEKDKVTAWDGVRNYLARNHMREMKKGEPCIYFHTGDQKEAVAIAEISKEAYQDPTTDEIAWVCVDVIPVKKLDNPVSLKKIKEEPLLANCGLVRISRLSVVKLSKDEFDLILKLSATA